MNSQVEGVPHCPHCEAAVKEIHWEATLVRTRLDDHGEEILYPLPDRIVSVGTGTLTVLPCGHRVDYETAVAIEKSLSCSAAKGTPRL